MLESVVY